ncbi:hypothetical protein [Streptantibioticus parmotrematis]|uniref:hypothetical protein n=1 Tax=Streptantibioticus parmotrematis TaxID=2873249 RepID=UPI00207BF8A4|nr:hypothetical protein [Streptantibioticus parmotrematis]
MKAPSAAQPPQSVRALAEPSPAARPARRGPDGSGGGPSRVRRTLVWLAATGLLAAGATGCVTVHGERALVPSVQRADATKALERFVRLTNEANTQLDPSVNTQAETGALGAIDGAGIKARHVGSPAGNPGYKPLVLTDSRLVVPRQRGWPKWFVVDTADNRDKDRWLLVFTRDSVAEQWKASYLLVVTPGADPRFATDTKGYAEPVPVTGSGLLLQPGGLGPAYAAYLQRGDAGSPDFAAGPDTTVLRQQRRTQYAPTPQVVTQFADAGADPVRYPPVALRLADGGALVFFTTQHTMKQTVAKGPVRVQDPTVNALLTGTPSRSVTLTYVSEQVATVPSAATGGGEVVFVDRIAGLVSATGQ